jgi:putative membrane protein
MKKQFKSVSSIALVTLAGCTLCLGPSAQAANESPKKEPSKSTASPAPAAALSAKDKSFMKEAAKGGMMEVDMGKMAQQKGKSPEVKKIGSTMVADHSKANNELMAIAKKKGVDLSKEKPKSHSMGDANFDKDYVNMMVKDHEKDLAAFQAEAKEGSDADVKAFASKTSSVIKKHLDMVKAAQAKIK